MASVVKIKRSAIAGKRPTTSNIETGELALNLSDGRLFSSNGTSVFEVGANVHSLHVGTGEVSFGNGAFTFPTTDGTNGQVLSTNGSGNVTWQSISSGGLTIEQANSSAATESYTSITTLQFDEDSGFDVTNPSSGVAKVAMNSTFKYWQVNGNTQLTAVGLDTVNFIAGDGVTISANGSASPQELTISASGGATVSDNAPSSPSEGDLWFDSTNLKTYVYYSSTWVQTNPTAAGVSNSYLTSTYTSNAVFQAFVANTNAAIAAAGGEVSNAYLTSTFTTNTAFQSALANTNAYIASVAAAGGEVSNATFQSALANTNAYIATKTDDTVALATNTALRTLISDRVQVANLNSTLSDYWPSANVISHVSSELSALVDSAPSTLDTLNELAAALGDDANFSTTVTNSLASKATWAALTATNTAIRTLVSDTLQVANAAATYLPLAGGTISGDIIPSTDGTINLGSSTKAFAELYLSGNTIRLGNVDIKDSGGTISFYDAGTTDLAATQFDNLINDRLQVANAAATYQTIAVERAALANTNSYIATKLNTATFNSALANTNAYIASVAAAAGDVSNTTFQAFVANTNAYIAASAGSAGLSNTEVENIVDARINVLDLGDVVGTDGNAGQILISYGDGTAYWSNNNPSVDLSGYVTNTAFQSALANTNAYIASVSASAGQVSNAYLTSSYTTNTTFQSALANTNIAVADRMQVANVVSYTAKYLEVANVTSTDTSSLATWAALTATNTAIRTLVDDRVQVANLNSTIADYWPSANVISHVSTELASLVDSAPSTLDTLNELAAALGDDANFSTTVTNSLAAKATWSALTATNTAIRTLVDDRLQVANAAATYATISTFNSALANTNAYIATVAAAPSGLSNTEVENIVDARINVLDLGDVVGTDGNAGQILISYGDGTAYWSNNNPSVDLSGYVTNTAFQSALANTNAYVATKTDDTVVLATNTALRTLIDDRMQVANVVSYTSKYLEVANVTSTDTSSLATWSALIATNTSIRSAISTEVANLVDSAPAALDTLNELAAALGDDANFSATVTTSLAGKASNAAFQSALANTNSYIATKLDSSSYTTSDVQSKAALANTNAYIATKANESDSLSRLANTNAYIATKLDSSSYTTADVQSKAALANTNAYIASVSAAAGDVSNTDFQAALANTNAYIASVAASAGLSEDDVNELIDGRVNVLDLGDIVGTDGDSGQILISYGDGTAYWSNNNPSVDLSGYVGNTYLQSTFVSNTAFQSFVANTNAAIANAGEVSNSYLTSTYTSNATFQSFVANTNAYIATKTGDATVLATNTALRTLISDRVQVANLNSTLSDYWPSANVISYVSGEITSLIDSAPGALDTLNELAAALGDDANFSATVTTSLAGKAANSYVNSTFVSNTAFQSFVANTNAYIAAGSGGLSNSEVSDIVDSKLQVLDIGDVVGADGSVNQVLLSNGDGTGQWGSAPSGMQEFAFTASNNQTTFTGADDYSSSLSYTAGKLLVFLNGVKMARVDFQANNGTSVVFNDGVSANDYVEFVAF